MPGNYLKIACRTRLRHRTFFPTNLAGLTVAIVTLLLMSEYIAFEENDNTGYYKQ